MTKTIDRSEVARSLAKAIAFKNVGKHKQALWWARQLIHQLECADILNQEEFGIQTKPAGVVSYVMPAGREPRIRALPLQSAEILKEAE